MHNRELFDEIVNDGIRRDQAANPKMTLNSIAFECLVLLAFVGAVCILVLLFGGN